MVTPAFLTICHIVDYRVAHELSETTKARNIVSALLADADSKKVDSITFLNPKQSKIAKRIYGDKGIPVLIEIENQIENEKK